MCLGVYLTSDRELQLIPWFAEAPAFHVRPLMPVEASVRRHLHREWIYSLDAHSGCGCGFATVEAEETLERQASRTALAEYVECAAARGPVELFVGWIGDEYEEIAAELSCSPCELVARSDWLEEGTRVRIRPSMSASPT